MFFCENFGTIMAMKIPKISHVVRLLKKASEKKKPSHVLVSVAIIAMGVIVALGILAGWKMPSFDWFKGQDVLTMEEIKVRTEQFITSSKLSGGKKVEIKEVSDAGKGLYRIMVQLEGGQGLIESFVTKDGEIFFPQGIPIENIK